MEIGHPAGFPANFWGFISILIISERRFPKFVTNPLTMVKRIFFFLLLLFVVIQFVRPAKNNSGDRSKDISLLYKMPDSVKEILQRSCADCHSNQTTYPWYDEIQPVAWWVGNHIRDGKRHFNLNNFTALRPAVQKRKMEECIDQIRDDEMPLGSYTLVHTNAKLSDTDKDALTTWFQGVVDSLKAHYPADSLVLKGRKVH